MGQRANLVVTRDGLTEVFYTHWRANTLPRDLFWGPEYAVAFACSQKKTDANSILDEIWAEGGAVIDADNKLLLLFGGEDIRSDVPARRLFMRLLKVSWAGWDVRWSHEGVCDLADYLAVPRSQVLDDRKLQQAESVELAEPPSDATTVLSLRRLRGQVVLFPCYRDIEDLVRTGPKLLDLVRTGGVDEVHFSDTLPNSGGFHVDDVEQSLEIWTASDAPNIVERVSTYWNGWNLTWHRDAFEFQVERTGGRMTASIKTDKQLLVDLRQVLLRDEEIDAVQSFMEMTDILAKDGHENIRVNPEALRDARLTLPRELREQILDRAIAGL